MVLATCHGLAERLSPAHRVLVRVIPILTLVRSLHSHATAPHPHPRPAHGVPQVRVATEPPPRPPLPALCGGVAGGHRVL